MNTKQILKTKIIVIFINHVIHGSIFVTFFNYNKMIQTKFLLFVALTFSFW